MPNLNSLASKLYNEIEVTDRKMNGETTTPKLDPAGAYF